MTVALVCGCGNRAAGSGPKALRRFAKAAKDYMGAQRLLGRLDKWKTDKGILNSLQAVMILQNYIYYTLCNIRKCKINMVCCARWWGDKWVFL